MTYRLPMNAAILRFRSLVGWRCVLFLVIWLNPTSSVNGQAPPTSALREVHVGAGDFFAPDKIEVSQGDRVRMIIYAGRSGLEIHLDDYGIHEKLNTRGATVVEFDATEVGRFAFSCPGECARLHPLLKGEIIVTPRNSTAFPEDPVSVSVCEIVENATTYDGRWVEIRANVTLEFEGFYIDADGCSGIWVGNTDFNTIFVWGRGRDFQKSSVALRVDEDYTRFRNLLTAQRLCHPKNDKCYGIPKRVEATLIGRLDVAPAMALKVHADKSGKFLTAGNGSGFGHFSFFGARFMVAGVKDAVGTKRSKSDRK